MSAIPLWPGPAPAFGIAPEGDDPRHAEARQHVPSITPFLHPDGGVRGAVIICAGGGYRYRNERNGAPVANWLQSIGLHAFVLDYRVWPHRHPAPLTDAQRAIRLVRARAGDFAVDPAKVAILGFSAGGHLAASAATLPAYGQVDHPDPVERQSAKPDALIAGYPVITMQDWGHAGSRQALIGDAPGEDLRELLSLERSVTAKNPPTFLWSTSDDAEVGVDNALLFASSLRRFSVPFALHVYPRGAHGLGLAEGSDAAAWPADCATWLRGIGFLG